MKLQFLGTGGAFTKITDNFQSNMTIQSANGRYLLIDCGSDARHSLDHVGLKNEDIDGVYISHLHSDHVGGLEWLAFTRRFGLVQRKPKLYAHPQLVSRLWTNVLSGGLQSLEGDKPAAFSDFFELMPIIDNRYTWEGIDFQLVKTLHASNGKKPCPSFGLYFKGEKKTVFISTDTQFMPERYNVYFENADLIFHDCDTGTIKSPVHAHFSELVTLPEAIKAKMWLYHYSSDAGLNPQAHGFLGFVRKGQSFEL